MQIAFSINILHTWTAPNMAFCGNFVLTYFETTVDEDAQTIGFGLVLSLW